MALPSGTVTLLFTDIEGSTALWEGYREHMEAALPRHDELLRSAIESSGGYVFKTIGDAFCAAFSIPAAAAMAAIEAQRSLQAEAWREPVAIKVRMGLHSGACEERDGDYFGPAVNRTARLEAIAHGGQILLSGVTAELVREALPPGLEIEDLGEHRLKDLGRPEHVFELTAPGLERTFPPLRSLDNPNLEHNLPIQFTSFVGRDNELSEIHRLNDESRLVTLTGPAGSGKTRLALQVAADLLDGSGDGVWLVELAPLSAGEQVAREVASVLGVREGTRPLLETLTESLQYRNLLLVLDNCEHVVDACAKLAEAIVRQCPRLWILATSRESLGVEGERVYRVPPLGLPDGDEAELEPGAVASAEAVRLFVERAREHRPEFTLEATNAATVVSLCRHLDGIPLALELAAAQLGSMSLAEVERRLSQRFRLLSTRSRRRSARQQTLEGAVAWSYELLNESEKLTFSTLSVFPGAFELAAAESVCATAASLDALEVVHLVQALVEKSLLQAEEGPSDLRYRMLETIRHYAADRLADLGDESTDRIRRQHALYYLDMAERAAPHLVGVDQLHWIDYLAAEYDNLRTALSYLAYGADRGIEALRMIASLRYFWEMSASSRGEARELSVAALASPLAQSPSRERAAALVSLGQVDEQLGEISAARAAAEAGVSTARVIGDEALVADNLTLLAFAFYRLGEYDRFKDAAREALQAAKTAGDPILLARAHDRMALADSLEDPALAREHYAEALALFKRAGNRWRVSATYNNLADTEMKAGDLVAARSNLEAALEHAFTGGTRAIALMNLGTVTLLEGDSALANSRYREALRHLVRTWYWVQIPIAVLGLALCSTASGQLERASALHGAADAMLEDQGIPYESLEASLHDRDVAILRERMGNRAFESAYFYGHEMSEPDAIALALDLEEPGTVSA